MEKLSQSGSDNLREHRLMPNMLRTLKGDRQLADQIIGEVEDSLWLAEEVERRLADAWDRGAEYGLQRGMGDYDSWILSDNPHREPYTPTIADVQSYYVMARRSELLPQPQDLTPLSCEFDRALKAEVVRRIAEAKAEAKAEAWDGVSGVW